MNYEQSRWDHFENRGTILEHEFFDTINKPTYGTLAKELLGPKTTQPKTHLEIERQLMAKYEERTKYLETLNSDSYINYKDAMRLVEKCQPGDPCRPKAFFANSIVKNLNEKLAEGYILKFFTAVGSHLDTKHGVDAFIKLYNKEGKEVACATIDISQHEKPRAKANMVIVVSNRDRDLFDRQSDFFDREEFAKRIDFEANRIIDALETDRNDRRKKLN